MLPLNVPVGDQFKSTTSWREKHVGIISADKDEANGAKKKGGSNPWKDPGRKPNRVHTIYKETVV